jgi:hypothetical protein
MAEPTRYTTLEADAGGLPSFTTPSSIFDVPSGLLNQPSIIGPNVGGAGSFSFGTLGSLPTGFGTNVITGINALEGLPFGSLLNRPSDLGGTTVSGNVPVFNAPATSISFGMPGSMAPSGMSLSDLISPWNIRTDITQLAPNWGTWNPSADVQTAGDFTGVKLTGTPFNNAPIAGSEPRTDIGANVQTGAQETAVMMDPYKVKGTTEPNLVLDPNQYVTTGALGGSALLGGVTTTATSGVTTLDPFQVVGTKLPSATLTFGGQTAEAGQGITGQEAGGATVLPKMTVTGDRVTTPTMSSQDMIDLLTKATTAWGTQPITLPPVVSSTSTTTATTTQVSPIPVTTSVPTVTPPVSTIVPPAVTVPPSTTPTSTPTGVTPTTTSTAPTITQTGTATPTTITSTSSAMTERDIAKELAKTLPALQQNQTAIQQMYGDLYNQFMPAGITAAEPSLINQYKQDLARLQQRQAGILSPEDVRQSQQAAREAYGARGQVMGPGAIGAEILNREAIRQQREDQARSALQQSYGNILNTANIQTGNLFSPIASLMSGTFNPLGAYPADVYGTNVNAQLAREIAQKNYEAAVKSAELSGSAQKSAATTSAAGSIFGPALGTVAAKGIGTLFGLPIPSCLPGDQCIDTPTGPKAVKELKGGDQVIGYDGNVAYIAQACSWNQDPLRTFLTITREDGSSFTVCDDHKILGIPAMEWVEGAELAGSKIKSIKPSTGLLTSYDILTNQGGYRINGVPVNSMIPEIIMQVVEFHRQVDRNLQAASA